MNAPDTAHYEGQDLEALSGLVRYQSWILRWIRPHLRGRVLEVGAGVGAIADHYVDLVGEAVLLEPAANLATRLRARFADRAHVSVHEGTLDTLDRADGSLDAAVLVNVLEHIPDDLGALRRLHALVRPGGALAIMVPAMSAIYGSLDALVGHVRRYERAQLREVVTAAGFRVETLRWLDAAGVIPWLVFGRVLRQRRFNPAVARLYDRVAVPVSRAIEERVEPPWGKNLICIARRDS
ncbi:MAG: methyltransferase domain-containing protein [Polyangiales bacterium]